MTKRHGQRFINHFIFDHIGHLVGQVDGVAVQPYLAVIYDKGRRRASEYCEQMLVVVQRGSLPRC